MQIRFTEMTYYDNTNFKHLLDFFGRYQRIITYFELKWSIDDKHKKKRAIDKIKVSPKRNSVHSHMGKRRG